MQDTHLEPLAIRPMTPADIPQLRKIDAETRSTPWSTETFEKELANPLSRISVLIRYQECCGFIITWVVGDELQIHHIAVRKADQGRGWAERLLRHALANGRQRGAALATLEVRSGNGPARRLYEKCGFVEVGRRPGYYRQPADDAILMNAHLSDEIV